MTTITQVKLGLALAGLAVWAYAARMGIPRLQWVGIALVALALILRFVRPRRREHDRPSDRHH